MKTKLFLSMVLVLSATNAFAKAIALSSAQGKVIAFKESRAFRCKNTNNYLKAWLKPYEGQISKEDKAVCANTFKKAEYDLCKMENTFLKNLEQMVSEKNADMISKNLGKDRPDDAVNAVLNWKVSRAIDDYEHTVHQWTIQHEKVRICKINKLTTSDYIHFLVRSMKQVRYIFDNVKLDATIKAEDIHFDRPVPVETELPDAVYEAGVR